MENFGNRIRTFIRGKKEGSIKDVYEKLSISSKFEVLERWIDHRVSYAINTKKYSFGNLSLIQFFVSNCRDLHPGTKQHAIRMARRCYYCETELSEKPSPKGMSLPTAKTVDHFNPKRQLKLKGVEINRFVICCRKCNEWKSGKTPEQLVQSFFKPHGAIYAGFSESAYQRILAIMRDILEKNKTEGYYLS